jgi:uncharacterized protein (TIGR02466 family)
MSSWKIDSVVPFAIPIGITTGCLPNKDNIINSIEYLNHVSNSESPIYCARSDNLLNKKEFSSLSFQILKNFLDINEHLYQYDFSKVTPYITSIWANKYKKNQFIPSHGHPNSWFSGIYYPYGTGTTKTIFENPVDYVTLYPPTKNYNQYNGYSWTFTFPEDTMIFFPSYLKHKTTRHQDDTKKISISFNIFLRGILSEVSELSLKI